MSYTKSELIKALAEGRVFAVVVTPGDIMLLHSLLSDVLGDTSLSRPLYEQVRSLHDSFGDIIRRHVATFGVGTIPCNCGQCPGDTPEQGH